MPRTTRPNQPRYYSGGRAISRRGKISPVSPSPRRRRKPAPIIIIAGIILFVFFCWLFGKGCGETREEKEYEKLSTYTSEANKMLERENAVAVQFENFRNESKDLPREDISSKLNQMYWELKEISVRAGKTSVSEKSKRVHPFLVVGTDLRASGVKKFRSAILAVIDGREKSKAASLLEEGLMEMAIADECLLRFKSGLQEVLKSSKSGELGLVKVSDVVPFLTSKQEALPQNVSSFLSAFGAPSAGEVIRGVAITEMSLSPAPIGRTKSGVTVLPYSRTFAVSVEVQNQGNQLEPNVSVVAVLNIDTESTPQKVTKKIPTLKPNERVTIVFEDLKPATGELKVNILKVKAGPVKGERNLENNSKEVRFVMRSD